MKKLVFPIIGIICLTLIGYSVWAYTGEQSSTSAQGLKGSFISLDSGVKEIKLRTGSSIESYNLAKSVWVYRDSKKATLQDLKPEDQVEIILNSNRQAAYIKAYSKEGGMQEQVQIPGVAVAQEAPINTATNTPAASAPQTEPTIKPSPAVTEPKVTAAPKPEGSANESSDGVSEDDSELAEMIKEHFNGKLDWNDENTRKIIREIIARGDKEQFEKWLRDSDIGENSKESKKDHSRSEKKSKKEERDHDHGHEKQDDEHEN